MRLLLMDGHKKSMQFHLLTEARNFLFTKIS